MMNRIFGDKSENVIRLVDDTPAPKNSHTCCVTTVALTALALIGFVAVITLWAVGAKTGNTAMLITGKVISIFGISALALALTVTGCFHTYVLCGIWSREETKEDFIDDLRHSTNAQLAHRYLNFLRGLKNEALEFLAKEQQPDEDEIYSV